MKVSLIKPIVIVLLISLLPAASVYAAGELQGQFQKVTFASANYSSLRALIDNQKTSVVKIEAAFYKPQDYQKKIPAVILMHGSEGVSDQKEGAYARYFAKHNIATLVIDSYRSRGIKNTLADQGQLSISSQLADILNGLKFLSTQKMIDPEKIGVMGTSRGGLLALIINQRTLLPSLTVKPGFIIALYPCCLLHWQQPQFLNIPVLMMLAGNDSECSPEQCLQYGQQLKNAKQPLTLMLLQGACHGFDVNYRCQHLSQVNSFKYCPAVTITRDYSLLLNGKESTTWKQVLHNFKQTECVKKGASFGAGQLIKATAFKKVLEFIQYVARKNS